MGSSSYAQAIKPDTGKLRKLIESSLQYDWVIRVEYAGGNTEAVSWQQWDRTFFAVRTADEILLAVTSCYKNNPGSSIRLSAEKVRPQTHFLYTVYQPRVLAADGAIKPVHDAPYQNEPAHESTASTGSSLRI